MLALGRRRLRDGAGRLGRIACCRGGGLKPVDTTAAAGKCHGRAQQDWRSPKAAAHPYFAPACTLCHFGYS
jgi:hypothetical protein